jgi:hypothetical protein
VKVRAAAIQRDSFTIMPGVKTRLTYCTPGITDGMLDKSLSSSGLPQTSLRWNHLGDDNLR